MKIRIWAFPAAAALVGVSTIVCAQSASPFMPPTDSAPAEVVADPTLDKIQLSGISIIGGDQRFNLVDIRSKKSFWVDLGATENDITVESYSPDDDSVVIRHGDSRRKIELRRSVIVSTTREKLPPLPGSDLPGVPQAPEIPDHIVGVDEMQNPVSRDQVKQAEFEARMLVSDLLSISVRERARQKALKQQQAKERREAARKARSES